MTRTRPSPSCPTCRGDALRVTLTPTRAQASPLFKAMAQRQCTRGDDDSTPLSNEELGLLERAGSSGDTRLLLLTAQAAMEQTLDYVVQGNTAQMADPAFVKELKAWIRFNGADAARLQDGLYSASSGNPNLPAWLGNLAFERFFTPKGENDKYVRQIRSSAGIAVFVGKTADKAHWIDVGRCYERFALQATALGIKNAFLNQPVEVASVRPQFATAIGLAGLRVWLGRCLQWRVGAGWMAFAFFPPLPLALMAVVNFFLIFLAGGPLGEEFGWRGYALGHLQDRHGWRIASLVLGAAWGRRPWWSAPADVPSWTSCGLGSRTAVNQLEQVCAYFYLLESVLACRWPVPWP